jgi:hypothetical protein
MHGVFDGLTASRWVWALSLKSRPYDTIGVSICNNPVSKIFLVRIPVYPHSHSRYQMIRLTRNHVNGMFTQVK